MRRSFGLLFLLILTVFSFGQKGNRIIPQFDFMQIDSLTNLAIKTHISDSSFVAVQTNWYVGLWQIPDDSNYAACENPFDIYILFKKDNVFYMQHLDNFGYFEPKQIDGAKTKEFLDINFKTMKTEKLQPPLSGSEHQLVQKVKIAYPKDSIEYDLPADYSKNKVNARTNQFKFVRVFEKEQKKYRKNSEMRLSILRGSP